MFIVRGFQTGNVGKRTGQIKGESSLIYTYEGSDDIKRSTRISWDKKPHTCMNKERLCFLSN